MSYLRPFADQMYPEVEGGRLAVLLEDEMNHFNNFIDAGRGSALRKGLHRRETLSPELLRCKAFFRPHPTLRIMANGEVGICPLMQGKEGYGNIHRLDLADILNTLQDSLLHRLHASGEIGR